MTPGTLSLSSVGRLLLVAPLAWLLLLGCTNQEESGGLPFAKPTPTPTGVSTHPGGTVGGSENDHTPSSPTPTPSSHPVVTPTPLATAEPKVSVTAVHVTPGSAVLLPPAVDPDLSMGLSSEVQFSAYAQRSDDAQGGVVWVDMSGGQLAVSGAGKVSAKGSTLPGTYTVRVRAIDDANVYTDLTVRVLSTGELEAIIQ